jgi:hypothetical protein
MNYAEVYREIQQGTAAARLPGWVMEELTEVAEGRRQLTAIRHPLGFVCLPLQRDGEYGICVHAWPYRPAEQESSDTRAQERTLTTSPMHSHSWDLLSFVLYGEVHNQLVQVSDAPTDPTHQLCEVVSDGDTDEIRPTGRVVRWAPGPSEATPAGESYLLAAGEFHMTVIPEQTQAATIVLGRGRSDGVDMSLGSLDTRTHRVSRQRCARRETAGAASLVVRRLADRMTKSSKRGG